MMQNNVECSLSSMYSCLKEVDGGVFGNRKTGLILARGKPFSNRDIDKADCCTHICLWFLTPATSAEEFLWREKKRRSEGNDS